MTKKLLEIILGNWSQYLFDFPQPVLIKFQEEIKTKTRDGGIQPFNSSKILSIHLIYLIRKD